MVKGGYAAIQLPKEFRKDIQSLGDDIALLVGVLHSLLPLSTEVSPIAGKNNPIQSSAPKRLSSV